MTRGDRKIFVCTGAALLLLSFASAVKVSPKLVWNATQSAPIGLYRIEPRTPKLGDYVLVSPSKTLAEFIEERQYLPPDTPLIKRVAAITGDEICREYEAIFINKTHVADALLFDSRDREMPQWSGCFTLKINEIFLLNAHEKSLDGRYFGATKRNEIIGVAIPGFVKE